MWSCFLWPVLHAGDCPRDGPIIERRARMTEERVPPEVLERATQAVTRPTTLPLNEFVLKPELYCHRDQEELKNRDRLKPLMDSLIVEGLRTPVEFFRDEAGNAIPTRGHRRISG